MSRQRRICRSQVAAAALLLLSLTPARGAELAFQGELDPFAFTPATRADVVGVGDVSAVLDGDTLTVTGKFSELSSPATAAHLRMGLAMGVPGPEIGELSIAHEAKGEISGKLSLTPAQVAALKASAVYVQLDSVKAPGGALWGWLEPR
jgi:hypothetical protein